MPELPEVETVVRGLRGPLLERTFLDVEVRWARSVVTGAEALRRGLPGRRVEAIDRRGKYLVFRLDDPRTLLIHLKMSGNLLVEPDHAPRDPYMHTVFQLDNGHQLRLRDPRKFGRVYLTTAPDTVLGRLGPEPLADDFSVADFLALCRGRRGVLKALLLNQEFLAGLGNIYASEACFLAGLDPRRPISGLRDEEVARLYHAIRRTLGHGIVHKGSSLDSVYRGGEFQNHFQVYGRESEACFTCGANIERVMLGGRSTCFCPRCQR
ncbi:MAG: bifunctional DNA-formamidopyrimidine glycosylase/DNA-(apurinic or apyrimidinic site) lyase [Acidobacteria bacterium]|nr:bifunctional DNA-formamidopyrimidine glycosylase/DNA-(apurinic or apyrimidinic site) lyase [Acidobacteriota bacterium]